MTEKNDRAASDEIPKRLPRSFQVLLKFARSKGLELPEPEGKEKVMRLGFRK